MYMAYVNVGKSHPIECGPTDSRDEASRLARAIVEEIATENRVRATCIDQLPREILGVRISRVDESGEEI